MQTTSLGAQAPPPTPASPTQRIGIWALLGGTPRIAASRSHRLYRAAVEYRQASHLITLRDAIPSILGGGSKLHYARMADPGHARWEEVWNTVTAAFTPPNPDAAIRRTGANSPRVNRGEIRTDRDALRDSRLPVEYHARSR